MQLAAQHMEVVRRCRRIDDLHVVLGAHLQVPLQTRGGMLWSLPFIAMRQQANEARHTQPLTFTRRYELVEEYLRAVGEVAELSFPHRERIGLSQRIAVF